MNCNIYQVDVVELYRIAEQWAGKNRAPEYEITTIPIHWADRDVETFLSARGTEIYYAYSGIGKQNEKSFMKVNFIVIKP